LTARHRIELALLATADHPAVQPVLDRVTRRRIGFTARLFERLGGSRPEAKRRALLAYSAYLGHAQLVHATPHVLPQSQSARRAYLDDVLATRPRHTAPPKRASDPAVARLSCCRWHGRFVGLPVSWSA
jgi:hypothetical protein